MPLPQLPGPIVRDALLVGIVPQLLMAAAGHYWAVVARGFAVGAIVIALLVSLLAGAWSSPTSSPTAMIVGAIVGGGSAIVGMGVAYFLGDAKTATIAVAVVGSIVAGALGGTVGAAAARAAFGG
jgi:hypothetical protein